MAQISTGIAADFIVYVLPMPTLAMLNLPLSQRIVLMVVFGFGAVVVVAGCLRLYYVHLTVYETFDVTWVGFNLWIWTSIEVNLGIICGCVPALKPLVYKASHLTSSYFKSNSYSSRKSRSYANESNPKSQGPDIEPNRDASLVDRNMSQIEKTVDWSVEETNYSPSFNTTKPLEHQGSWLDDENSDSNRGSQIGHYGLSAADITKSSFGLKR
jgi:hypothetical protein